MNQNPKFKIQNPEIGRILRASTTGFAAGCRVQQLNTPSFGALTVTRPINSNEAIYGLIYDMHIDDDPLVRRLVLAENPRPSVIEDQRNNRLLPIEMSILSIGYEQNGTIHYSLPPRPPLNLDPVYLITNPADIIRFTDNLAYLRLILRNVGQIPVDQLLISHIRQTHAQRGDDNAWALATLDELIELLRNNYELLIPTLEALSASLPSLF